MAMHQINKIGLYRLATKSYTERLLQRNGGIRKVEQDTIILDEIELFSSFDLLKSDNCMF